jgi:uncharacterized protein
VNVLVALAWPNHVHHAAALAWFRGIRDEGWATCPLTESGFVRVSCHQGVPDARRPAEAIALLQRIRAVAGHVFWADEVSPADDPAGVFARLVGHRQVTDAHLLTLAHLRGGVLATFDRGIRDLAGDELVHAVELLG